MSAASGGPWAVTYDANAKAKVHATGPGAVNRERHLGREADLEAGFEFAHGNTNIDRSRTHLNLSFVNDGQGGFRRPVVTYDVDGNARPPSAEFADYRRARLSAVKHTIRKDGVIGRGVMLQLSSRWFDEHCPDWRENGLNAEAMKYVGEQMQWAVDEFGQENIGCGSIDLDETSVHVQLFVIPVTNDGRLDQKTFFKGPRHLQKQRADLCDRLEAVGFDPDRQVTPRSTESTSSAEYGRAADRVKKLEAENEALKTKLDATLAVAKSDGQKLWKERQAVKTELEELAAGRAQLQADNEELPALRKKAEEAGKAQGLAEAAVEAQQIVSDAQEEAAQILAAAQAAARSAHHKENKVDDLIADLEVASRAQREAALKYKQARLVLPQVPEPDPKAVRAGQAARQKTEDALYAARSAKHAEEPTAMEPAEAGSSDHELGE